MIGLDAFSCVPLPIVVILHFTRLQPSHRRVQKDKAAVFMFLALGTLLPGSLRVSLLASYALLYRYLGTPLTRKRLVTSHHRSQRHAKAKSLSHWRPTSIRG
ncbi:hypothetical protein B0H11DRAFT_2084951 [Mycena galericulata]|nr:hypothetical protein B0H11DRAFT_2084951 [Mycena galericulata]